MANPISKEKALGQYPTGPKLARLLSALAEAQKAKTIIDPMAGNGDMLEACFQSSESVISAAGIEIDPVLYRSLAKRLQDWRIPRTVSLLGSAFDPGVIAKLPTQSFDLVITNPPYVRYQSMSKSYLFDIYLPSSLEIRSSLRGLVDSFPSLDKEDKILFRKLVSSYSGLSDLAVPSWILCAMLTRIGGRLGVVVPETWLSRNYALIVQYMLMRWFRIRYVVEDLDAVWFDNALVKTTLVVAERIERRTSAFDTTEEGYLHVQLLKGSITRQSSVGNVFPNSRDPDSEFAEYARRCLDEKVRIVSPHFSAEWVPLLHQAGNLRRLTRASKWVGQLERWSEAGALDHDATIYIPEKLRRWLSGTSRVQFVTLRDLGVNVSQGLRTGANQFFYVELLGQSGDSVTVKPNSIFGGREIEIPAETALPVLRRQSELDDCYQIEVSKLTGRVLALEQLVLPEDMITETYGITFEGVMQPQMRNPMPDSLAAYVRHAATIEIGSGDSPKHIPELSAVRPNIRPRDPNDPHSLPRYWYMLPKFTRRHRPDLFVARVNSGHPRTILNSSERALIDANFSTLWLEASSPVDVYGVLAFLNSSWVVAFMELAATVMGGGALKLEATHLRRLPVPAFDEATWSRLSELGRSILESQHRHSVLKKIDLLVVESLHTSGKVEEKYTQLVRIKETQLSARTRKHG